MGTYIGIELVLYVTLILEISFYLNYPGSLIVHIVIFISFFSTQGNLSSWQQTIQGMPGYDLALQEDAWRAEYGSYKNR